MLWGKGVECTGTGHVEGESCQKILCTRGYDYEKAFDSSLDISCELNARPQLICAWDSHFDYTSTSYLAFENTIQDGYVTEKLFAAMMLPKTIPVYYGAPLTKRLNITNS
jgi:hypothetical protein